MTDHAFSKDWIQKLSDPYAVLGVSVTADDRRILKRYRQVAKQLHPDIQVSQPSAVSAFANQVLTHLVNPAYQKIKQDKGRKETLATLRFKVRRLTHKQTLTPKGDLAKALMNVPEANIDVFYEKSLNQLAFKQFDSQASFDVITAQVAELNLVYLRRKMGDPVIREKRTGLVATTATQTVEKYPSSPGSQPQQLDYAERHRQRAQEYIRSKNYMAAIQELKDAVRISPRNSDFHCLLGQVYLLNNLPGMAKVHIKQALR
ncbi:molecular chaperone DnaJ, partial [filamentous cyanobacterium CCP5]